MRPASTSTSASRRCQYLWTQSRAILLYLRLALWPHPLALYYDWKPAAALADAWPSVAAVTALCLATAYGVARRLPVAFAGAVFFLVLGPTSSLLPIPTELVAERHHVPAARGRAGARCDRGAPLDGARDGRDGAARRPRARRRGRGRPGCDRVRSRPRLPHRGVDLARHGREGAAERPRPQQLRPRAREPRPPGRCDRPVPRGPAPETRRRADLGEARQRARRAGEARRGGRRVPRRPAARADGREDAQQPRARAAPRRRPARRDRAPAGSGPPGSVVRARPPEPREAAGERGAVRGGAGRAGARARDARGARPGPRRSGVGRQGVDAWLGGRADPGSFGRDPPTGGHEPVTR